MLWLKALHLIFIVTWFAGLFYLPRLFVYHAMTDDLPGLTRFRTMERKLYNGIMNPSAVLAIGTGIWLLLLHPASYLTQIWMLVKLPLVAALVAYHLYCGHLIKAFRSGNDVHSHIFYRWINEVPLLVLIPITMLAVMRPF